MKKYKLKCLNHECGEVGDIWAKLDDPMALQCSACEEEFSEEQIREYIADTASWTEYLRDYEEMLEFEKQVDEKMS